MGFIWELNQVLKRPFLDADCPGPASCVCTKGKAQSPGCVTKGPCLEQCDHDGTDLARMVRALWALGMRMVSDCIPPPGTQIHTDSYRCPARHPHTHTGLSHACTFNHPSHPNPRTPLPVSETLGQWCPERGPGGQGPRHQPGSITQNEFQIQRLNHTPTVAPRRILGTSQLHRTQRHTVTA